MKYRTFEFADRIHEFLGPRKHDLETDIREISRLLESENPSMISRIGSVEFQALFSIIVKIKEKYENECRFFPSFNENT